MFDQDIKKMSNKGYTFEDLCTVTEDFSQNPLLEALRSSEINVETVVLLDILVNFLKRVRSVLSDPLGINNEVINVLLKYKLIMLQKPLPRNKIRDKVLLSFTN
jgi:hypothetical protein